MWVPLIEPQQRAGGLPQHVAVNISTHGPVALTKTRAVTFRAGPAVRERAARSVAPLGALRSGCACGWSRRARRHRRALSMTRRESSTAAVGILEAVRVSAA